MSEYCHIGLTLDVSRLRSVKLYTGPMMKITVGVSGSATFNFVGYRSKSNNNIDSYYLSDQWVDLSSVKIWMDRLWFLGKNCGKPFHWFLKPS